MPPSNEELEEIKAALNPGFEYNPDSSLTHNEQLEDYQTPLYQDLQQNQSYPDILAPPAIDGVLANKEQRAMEFSANVQAKKDALVSAKQEATIAIAKSKFQKQVIPREQKDNQSLQQIEELLSIAPPSETVSDLLNVSPDPAAVNRALSIGENARSLKTTSPIVERMGPISKHADGKYSVVTAEGVLLPGLSEVDAKTLAAYNQENYRAVKAGAPRDFLGTKLSAIGQTTIDLGAQAASAFTTDSSNLQAIEEFC